MIITVKDVCMSGQKIHPTAIIDPGATLGDHVEIGPYSVIADHVILEEGVKISSHCHVEGRTRVGAYTQIFPGAVIGTIPQDKKFHEGDEVYLEIGKRNVIRECVTMNPGTLDCSGKTVIGDGNLFMAYTHVAHDCVVGNNCVFANLATLAGHVTIEDNAVIGGLTGIHQFVRVGRLAMVGGCSRVTQDAPPFGMCADGDAKVYGLNLIGLRRAGVSKDAQHILKSAFKYLFRSGLSKSHALEKIQSELTMCPELEHLVRFVEKSERGLLPGAQSAV